MHDLLAETLNQEGIAASLIATGDAMPTVPLAAAALGVPAGQIVKSIAFEGRREPCFCLALAPGDCRIDVKKVAAALGLPRLHLASGPAVLEKTGYAGGGVPPVGHATRIATVIERRLLELDRVFGGGGDEWHMLEISPREIVRATGAVIADIVQDAQERDGEGAA